LGDKIKHGLQHALIKAFKRNSANLNPDWLYAACNQSHPSLKDRLMAINKSDCSPSSIVGKKVKKNYEGIKKPLLEDEDDDTF
jgi:hypothetical protein